MKSRITEKDVKDLKLKFLNNLAVYGAETQMEFTNKFLQPFDAALRHVFEIADDAPGCGCHSQCGCQSQQNSGTDY